MRLLPISDNEGDSSQLCDNEKSSVTFSFEGKLLKFRLPVYLKTNTCYLPFTEVLEKTGLAGNPDAELKRRALFRDGILYASLYDITRILDLKTDWKFEEEHISLFSNREKKVPGQVQTGKPAFVRLEDVAAGRGYRYATAESLEKLRIIADYFYSEGIPFHISWVPRYMNPLKREDNNLLRQNSIYNADFLFTLRYMMDRNGIVGLHGYTHQYDIWPSLEGTEFNTCPDNSTLEYIKARMMLAIETARRLEIPCSFFVPPHHQITTEQCEELDDLFDVFVYGRGGDSAFSRMGNGRTTYWIPSPLQYVNYRQDLPNMIRKIEALGPGVLASFFYHPSLEFEDITIIKDYTGYPSAVYSDSSILHQLMRVFGERGYAFRTVHDLKNQIALKGHVPGCPDDAATWQTCSGARAPT